MRTECASKKPKKGLDSNRVRKKLGRIQGGGSVIGRHPEMNVGKMRRHFAQTGKFVDEPLPPFEQASIDVIQLCTPRCWLIIQDRFSASESVSGLDNGREPSSRRNRGRDRVAAPPGDSGGWNEKFSKDITDV